MNVSPQEGKHPKNIPNLDATSFDLGSNIECIHSDSFANPVQILKLGMPAIGPQETISEFVKRKAPHVLRLMVNFHVGDNPFCAIGCNPLIHHNHGVVSGATIDELLDRTQVQLDSSQRKQFEKQIGNNIIDGFLEIVDGKFKKFVIRVNDHSGDYDAPEKYLKHIDKYRQAYRIATEYAKTLNGEVKFTYDGEGIAIIKALGLLSCVQTDSLAPAQYCQTRTERLGDIEFYYNKGAGTRYLTPDHLAELLDIVADRERFLNQMALLVDNMRPSYKGLLTDNKHYAFLMFNGEKQEFGDIGDVQGDLYYELSRYYDQFNNIAEEEWEDNLNHTIKNVQNLIYEHNLYCSEPFAYDENISLEQKTRDERYVRLLRRRLEPTVDSSTMVPVDVGYFDLNDPNKPFIFSENISKRHRAIVQRFLDKNDCSTAHYLSLLLPKRPLNYDQHPVDWLSKYGESVDRSVVVCIGTLKEEGKEVDYREHPKSGEYWKNTKKVEARNLAKQFEGKEHLLTELNTLGKQSQIELMNGLYGRREKDPDSPVPNYIQDEIDNMEYLVRIRVEGKSFDEVELHNLTKLELEYLVKLLAPILAVNLVAQRNVLRLKELILLEEGTLDPNNNPGCVVYIGTAETFCNSSGLKIEDIKKVEDLTRNSEEVLGKFLFSFLAKFEFGEHDREADPSSLDMSAIFISLEKIFKEHFEGKLKSIRDNKLFQTDEVRVEFEAFREQLKSFGLDIPKDFDLTQYLELSERLANLSDVEIADLSDRVWKEVLVPLGKFKAFVQDEQGKPVKASASEMASLIDAFYALATNHLGNQHFVSELEPLFTGMMLNDRSLAKVDFSSFNLQERKWLVVLSDVSLWLREVNNDNKDTLHTVLVGLKNIAITSANANEFANRVSKETDIVLSEDTADRFYEAITGLFSMSLSEEFRLNYQESHLENQEEMINVHEALSAPYQRLKQAISTCTWGGLRSEDFGGGLTDFEH